MSYTAKIVGDKWIIKGSYVPKGHTCLCKSCNFTIEVPSGTSDEQIKELVTKITNR